MTVTKTVSDNSVPFLFKTFIMKLVLFKKVLKNTNTKVRKCIAWLNNRKAPQRKTL